MERFGLIGMIENKKHMENIWLKILKIKFSKPSLQEIWINILNLIHSVYEPDHKPNNVTHAAAQKPENQTWNFV